MIRLVAAAGTVRVGVTAWAVRRSPYTVQGWRPTSAVNQPVRIAMNGRGKLRKIDQSSGRLLSIRRVQLKREPSQASSSIRRPQPTMIRKAKKGIATGGRSAGGEGVRANPFESKRILAIKAPSPRILC